MTQTPISDWKEHGLHIYQVNSTPETRRTFRRVSRETCGESMEPPDDSCMIMFGQLTDHMSKTLRDSIVSVVCAKPAKSGVMDATKRDFFHWINFLFVKGDFQGRGFGSLLLNAAETELRLKALRPIRVESAYKAVEFFNSQGYRIIGEELECIFAGSALFRTLQTMEKFS
ncbi:uncharacterized protein LOC114976257 isoform X1 [Acropora millepora]|uniref:uncharacterized protein LOC114976257 isoform X1 n=1 Tax=Acropora millepora TaxID=45264 RepID=UPI0010FC97B5|nr:uncharacterized protein LOC114976257 isoform X1 [Acropora millepora]